MSLRDISRLVDTSLRDVSQGRVSQQGVSWLEDFFGLSRDFPDFLDNFFGLEISELLASFEAEKGGAPIAAGAELVLLARDDSA